LALASQPRQLRFECQSGCTNCCDTEGYVYLTEDDLRKAAAFLRLTASEFELRYVYRTKNLLRLRKPRGSQCHFLSESGCDIHPAKPTQCRLFPYWPELVRSAKAWERTGKRCPGIGKGPLVQIGDAMETASEMERAYPQSYPATGGS